MIEYQWPNARDAVLTSLQEHPNVAGDSYRRYINFVSFNALALANVGDNRSCELLMAAVPIATGAAECDQRFSQIMKRRIESVR